MAQRLPGGHENPKKLGENPAGWPSQIGIDLTHLFPRPPNGGILKPPSGALSALPPSFCVFIFCLCAEQTGQREVVRRAHWSFVCLLLPMLQTGTVSGRGEKTLVHFNQLH